VFQPGNTPPLEMMGARFFDPEKENIDRIRRFFTVHGTIASAVEAMKLGAVNLERTTSRHKFGNIDLGSDRADSSPAENKTRGDRNEK
jgi:hypothetical protein